jgi:hypothetical protein
MINLTYLEKELSQRKKGYTKNGEWSLDGNSSLKESFNTISITTNHESKD